MNTHALSPEAIADLCAASEFYEGRRAGLGFEFLVEVGIAVSRILEAPERWPEVRAAVRKFRLDRFPYGIFYRHLPSHRSIRIIAVMDLKRDPRRINDRLN